MDLIASVQCIFPQMQGVLFLIGFFKYIQGEIISDKFTPNLFLR